MRQGISINLLKQFFFIYNFIMNKRKKSLPLLRGDFYIFLSHKANITCLTKNNHAFVIADDYFLTLSKYPITLFTFST